MCLFCMCGKKKRYKVYLISKKCVIYDIYKIEFRIIATE